MEITVPFSSYKYMRLFALLAGLLGLAQALAWLGMSIVALIAYNCNISFTGVGPNYGNILRLTFVHMYFSGDCTPTNFPQVEFQAIEDLDLMKPSTVYIWMWVVAALSLFWLFSSVTLITNVKKSNIRYLNVFLYLWIFITFVISMVDLALFIHFILDYDTIMQRSYYTPLDYSTSTFSILVTAQNTAGMLASLALRGYLLWFINLLLTVYLFTQTFRVSDYNRMSQIRTSSNNVVQVNMAFSNTEELQGHSIHKNPPIRAYEEQPAQHLPWYNYLTTDIPRAHRHSQYPAPLVRSKSASNLDASFQNRMTMATARTITPTDDVVYRREQVNRELRDRQSVSGNYANLQPAPHPPSNYQPRPQLRSALRNSRYQ